MCNVSVAPRSGLCYVLRYYDYLFSSNCLIRLKRLHQVVIRCGLMNLYKVYTLTLIGSLVIRVVTDRICVDNSAMIAIAGLRTGTK